MDFPWKEGGLAIKGATETCCWCLVTIQERMPGGDKQVAVGQMFCEPNNSPLTKNSPDIAPELVPLRSMYKAACPDLYYLSSVLL